MERKRYILYITAGILLAFSVSFLLSFIITKNNIKEETIDVEPKAKEVLKPQEPLAEEEVSSSYYIISREGEMIKLSLFEDGKITGLRSEEVSLDVFPKADINMLEEGICAKTADEAYKVWENFIS